MEGRALGIGVAIFYVLPLILAVEGMFQPRAAWVTSGQPKLLWMATFVGGPAMSLTTGWMWPAWATGLASAFYMAKVRSTLLVAGGIERERRKRPPDPT